MSKTALPLVPKTSDGELFVVAIGRVSTVHQDVENIEASYDYIQDYLSHIYKGPMQIKLLGEQASGMLTERATIREAEELIATGKVDLVIAEDLARIYRNPRHQYNFVQDCVDMGTRVICVGDNLDTADENWEVAMGAASLRHGLHIPDTRRRVRRTATHCFHKGGMVLKIRFGYRKLTQAEAASGHFGPKDLRIAKLPECTPIIREMMQRVMRGDTYRAIAEWLETEGIDPGPYVKSGHWTSRLVVGLLDDLILSGTRVFRNNIHQLVFKTGKHKPIKNTEPEIEQYSQLAHLSVEEHETLRQEITRRRSIRTSKNGCNHNRHGIPRSRSFWPGQSATCGICNGLMYYSGKHVQCRNSLPRYGRSCWNHVQVPADLAREQVCGWLASYLDNDFPWRRSMVDAIWQELERTHRRSARGWRDLDREIASLERQAMNLATAIAQGGELQTLVQKLKTVEDALAKARATRAVELSQSEDKAPFSTKKQVDESLARILNSLAGSSFEFANLLRRIFPQFVIQPVQALDTGQVRPRAKLVFCPGAISNFSKSDCSVPGDLDQKQVTIDLFVPPLHIRHVHECLAAKKANPKLGYKKLSNLLNLNRMTIKRAIHYARLMEQAGTTDPYREIIVRPEEVSRWRNHRPTG